MKKLIPVFILGIALAFTACKKPPLPIKQDNTENGGGEVEVSPYVGKWSYTKIVMTNGTLNLGQQSFGTFDGTGKAMVGFVELKEGPNTFTAELEYTAAVNLTIFNQTQQQDIPVEKRVITGTWEEVGGQLKITASDGSDIDVVSSSASRIVFNGTFSEQIQLGGQFSLDAISDVEFTIEK